MKAVIVFVLLVVMIGLSGCTIMDGNAIITGDTRASISPSEVRLYRNPPESYEEIAIVSASAGHDFKKNSTLMNEAIQRLKEEAAKVGANGIILTEIDERDAPSLTTSYGSATATTSGGTAYATSNATSVNRGDSYTRLNGVAVYVSK